MLELATLVVVLLAVLIAVRLVRLVEAFIVNAIVGLAVLWIAIAVFEFEVAVTPVTVLVVALGGILGAIAVLVLATLELAFVPAYSSL